MSVTVASLPRVSWRHPEWWSLAICAGAWGWLLRMSVHWQHVHAPMQHWLAMTLAMMLPMALAPIRMTAERSLWRRRNRAMLLFLVGYVGLWMIFGLVVSPISFKFAGPIAFVVAGCWQLTKAKRIALAACHRTAPLAPYGWRADRDCVRYGLLIGTRCIVSCWALMLACALSGHALFATILGTAIGLVERYTYRPNMRLLAAALFAAALIGVTIA